MRKRRYMRPAGIGWRWFSLIKKCQPGLKETFGCFPSDFELDPAAFLFLKIIFASCELIFIFLFLKIIHIFCFFKIDFNLFFFLKIFVYSYSTLQHTGLARSKGGLVRKKLKKIIGKNTWSGFWADSRTCGGFRKDCLWTCWPFLDHSNGDGNTSSPCW